MSKFLIRAKHIESISLTADKSKRIYTLTVTIANQKDLVFDREMNKEGKDVLEAAFNTIKNGLANAKDMDMIELIAD